MTRSEELLALAEAATPGPWRKTCHGVIVADKGTGNTDDDYIVMWDDTPEHVETDAAFIAAANPETIRQLVELVRLLVPLVEDCCDSHMEYDNTKHKQAIEAFNKWENGK